MYKTSNNHAINKQISCHKIYTHLHIPVQNRNIFRSISCNKTCQYLYITNAKKYHFFCSKCVKSIENKTNNRSYIAHNTLRTTG